MELVIGREGQALTIDDGGGVTSARSRPQLGRGAQRRGPRLAELDVVNGRRISEVISLSLGDVVTLGSTSFRVEVDASTPATVASAPVPAPAPVGPAAREQEQPFGALAATNVAGRPRRAAASRSSFRAHRDLRRHHNRRAADSLSSRPLRAARRSRRRLPKRERDDHHERHEHEDRRAAPCARGASCSCREAAQRRLGVPRCRRRPGHVVGRTLRSSETAVRRRILSVSRCAREERGASGRLLDLSQRDGNDACSRRLQEHPGAEARGR